MGRLGVVQNGVFYPLNDGGADLASIAEDVATLNQNISNLNTSLNNSLTTLRTDLTTLDNREKAKDSSFPTNAFDALIPDYSRASTLVVNTTGVKPTQKGWLLGGTSGRVLTINGVIVGQGKITKLYNGVNYVDSTTSDLHVQILVQPSDIIKISSGTVTFNFTPCKGIK